MSVRRPTPFTERLGRLLQLQRRRHPMTQAELAERAELSLKYLGEIERGEANVTMDALERVAAALGWDPWTLFAQDQQPISRKVHELLLSELGHALQRLGNTKTWIEALDPTYRDTSVPATSRPTAVSQTLTPTRRGRPRKEGRDASDT